MDRKSPWINRKVGEEIMRNEYIKGIRTGVIFGTFLSVIIVSVLYLLFWILSDNNFYYFLFVSERFIMVMFLTIGLIVGFGVLGVIVMIYFLILILRSGRRNNDWCNVWKSL